MRVLFHAINGVGLGHLTRAATLAAEARALGHEVLVLTSALDTSLLRRAGLDHVRLPPRLAEPHASPVRCLMALDEPLERAAAQSVLDAFAPALVVFDTHAPPWLVRHARARGARVALVLRELRPEHLAAWLRSDLARAFDRVLVPHPADELDLARFPWFFPVAALGPVVRPLDTSPLSDDHARPLLVALAGGGGQPVDTARYLQAVADAHWLLRLAHPTLETVILPGPYGHPPPRMPPGVRVLGAVSEVAPWLLAADLVVSQAGYNAVAELHALGVPAVLVPGRRRAEDQSERARRLVRLGAARLARPDASALTREIGALLADPARRAAMRAALQRAPLRPRNTDAARWLLGLPAPSATAPLASPAPDAPRPLRVALVAHQYPPRLGGMETVAHQLARGLVAQGHEVVVYTCARLGTPADPGVTIRNIYTDLGPPASIDLWPDLLATLAALGRDEPDVVHLCHAGLAPWIPLLRAATGGAITINVHGNDLLDPWTHHGVDPHALRAATTRGLEDADAVLSVSDFTAALARRHHGPLPHLRIIHSGVDAERFRPGDGPRAPLILTVSRLTPRKGHATVIRALPAVLRSRPDARYAFTGDGEPLRSELLALADSLGVAHALLPVGRVDDDDLLSLYQRASVFVLTPTADDLDVEGFGLVLLEAAACGLPVIASRAGGTREAAGCVGGALIDPDDHEHLSRELLRLLSPATAPERDHARDLALAHPWSATVSRYIEVFRDTLRPHPRPLSRPRERGAPAAKKPPPAPPVPPLPPPLPRPGEGAGGVRPLDERSAAAHAAICAARSDLELREAARSFVSAEFTEREARRERYGRAIAAGKTIRLRATGAGKFRLAEALEDCAWLGHRPAVELRLLDALDPQLAPHLALLVGSLQLLHAVPSLHRARVTPRLRALPHALLARIASIRLSITPEALEDPSLIDPDEIDELASFCARHGVSYTPPA